MPVMQGTFGKYCRMHLRSWRDERHQTPKNNFQNFRFAASICTLNGLGLSKGVERGCLLAQRARPNADARVLDRYVQSRKVVDAALLLLMLEAASADQSAAPQTYPQERRPITP